ncbi:MAG TPA: ABC transporter ATP-binding protein [Fimbriiglobus sp.]|jgi:ABC-type polysaccharide/polyol phosphate transport system ATPase subunit|nr:ABC transporter ATP-binding protein [Fimbriiglobus sp.]
MAKIELDDVSLTFTVRQNRKVTLKEYLLRGLFLQSRNPRVAVHALSHLNLSAGDGDRIGVIGHNGAGKSTLLKLLAGVYPPTAGTRDVQGKICSLFDIALGFEHDASGWDNIRYRSYLLGETPRTVKKKMSAIAEFSELGDFLNIPVRYYSSGMLVRLAFSISTAVEPEVLLIDEVLGAGDLAFQIKAKQRMREMMASARLMVLVTHEIPTLEQICNRAIWLQHGSVMMDGKPDDVVAAYKASVNAPQAAPHVGGGVDGDGPAAELKSAA